MKMLLALTTLMVAIRAAGDEQAQKKSAKDKYDDAKAAAAIPTDVNELINLKEAADKAPAGDDKKEAEKKVDEQKKKKTTVGEKEVTMKEAVTKLKEGVKAKQDAAAAWVKDAEEKLNKDADAKKAFDEIVKAEAAAKKAEEEELKAEDEAVKKAEAELVKVQAAQKADADGDDAGKKEAAQKVIAAAEKVVTDAKAKQTTAAAKVVTLKAAVTTANTAVPAEKKPLITAVQEANAAKKQTDEEVARANIAFDVMGIKPLATAKDAAKGGLKWWGWVLIVIAIFGAIGAAYYFCSAKEETTADLEAGY